MALQDADDPPAAPAPAEPPDSSLLFFAAIRADDAQQLERALSEGASVDSTTALKAEDGFPAGYLAKPVTALMLAVGLGHNRIAKLLLERGAGVHTRGPFGTTATYHGACFGNVKMIAALVDAGGDVNVTDARGNSPIWIGESREFESGPPALPPTNVADRSTSHGAPPPTPHTALASRSR
jgi:hypothetical protein